jgi:phage gp46-like protein
MKVDKIMTRQEVLDVPVPAYTSTYAAVPHEAMIGSAIELVDKHGLSVINETYRTGRGGQQVIGRFDIDTGDSDLRLSIAWRNSYDRSMSALVLAGSTVMICENGCYWGDIVGARKHTYGIAEELKQIADKVDRYMFETFNTLVKDKEIMKTVARPSLRESAELVGRLLLEEELIRQRQLSVIQDEIKTSYNKETDVENGYVNGHFYGDTMWDFYNNITEGLKTCPPSSYLDNHVKLHDFFKKEQLIPA